ncbi:MAG TPA: hypothetical protein ENF21_04795 [Bacteroidetes bacterium]|nr:hypothetical protein [Bacteroidota bacterium]
MSNSRLSNKAARALETLWLVLALVCLITGIISSVNHGLKNSFLFFIFALIALLMFLIRRNMRRNRENGDNRP